jgi:hypothetical protein
MVFVLFLDVSGLSQWVFQKPSWVYENIFLQRDYRHGNINSCGKDMWIKLNSLSGLISVIYPQPMLVSEKKNLPILGFFSNKYRLLAIHTIKLDNFEDSNKKLHLTGV